ncbi:hypothetical protein SAMN06297251_11977 [Fulvimarina manganoxydans]|uniref:Uncharacterized protein n=1 Tax=Fulvimarina manganoxydans TaxID=937218 RepID=A0A1W2E002_9HYPH|nr:hypothetical protein SAMN06297251_11977 [Fulvimarina manganoxydans]
MPGEFFRFDEKIAKPLFNIAKPVFNPPQVGHVRS